MADHDLIIQTSAILLPGTKTPSRGVVGVKDGKIAFVSRNDGDSFAPSSRTIDVEGGVLLPGLVDLHAHPAQANSRFGVDPDVHLLPKGSTTVLSQGDAGARNCSDYIHKTIETSSTRVKLAINFCANGESNPAGRFFNLAEASVEECVSAIRDGGEHIWGISLNIAFIQGSDINPIEVLKRGIDAADQAGKPIMLGATKDCATPLEEQLKWLRPGDVMTYCFHSGDGSIVEDGRVLDCIWEARERGVLFDVGDGTSAFGFDVAETAISEGFLPDTISSDFYSAHVETGQDHDLPLTVSKLIACGMTFEQCWPRITSVPASILGLDDEIGQICPGAAADLCVLRQGQEPETLLDGRGARKEGRRWRTELTVRAGRVIG